MSVPVRDFLKKRRDRALGAILGNAERAAWFAKLTDGEREAHRRAVLDALNSYHDSVLDLVKAEDTSVVRNEEVIALLERIDRNVTTRP
jgi:hypothetical protein